MEEKIQLKDRVRYVEQTGPSIGAKLVRQDPWKELCNRSNYLTCSEKPGQCMKKGLVYQFTCLICLAEGKKKEYFGETYRSIFDGRAEHSAALKNKNRESLLYEKHEDEHGENLNLMFKMEIVGFYRLPLQRQTLEGLLIGKPQRGLS